MMVSLGAPAASSSVNASAALAATPG